MSKILKLQKDLGERGHADFFPELPPVKPTIKIMTQSDEEKPIHVEDLGDPEAAPELEKSSEAGTRKDPASDVVFVPHSDNRFPVAVLIVVAFFGIISSVLNFKLLEEIKFERETLTNLSVNIDKLAGHVSTLDQAMGQFKEQAVEETVGLKSSIDGLNSALTSHDSAVNGISKQMDELKDGLDQVNVALLENKSEIASVNSNNQNLETKLNDLDTKSQDLMTQFQDLKGVLKPAVVETK